MQPILLLPLNCAHLLLAADFDPENLMTTLTTSVAFDRTPFSLLIKLVQYLPLRKAPVVRTTAGLSFADISDVSIRAAAKSGLQKKRVATCKLRMY